MRSSSVWAYSLWHLSLGDIRTRLLLRKNYFFHWNILLFYVLTCMLVQYFRCWRPTKIIHEYDLGQYFERTLVWTMVWNSSGHWSGTCLISSHFGLELVWSEAASSALRAHYDLPAHTRLIKGHFGLGRSDQRSHLSGTVWSEAILRVTVVSYIYKKRSGEILSTSVRQRGIREP